VGDEDSVGVEEAVGELGVTGRLVVAGVEVADGEVGVGGRLVAAAAWVAVAGRVGVGRAAVGEALGAFAMGLALGISDVADADGFEGASVENGVGVEVRSIVSRGETVGVGCVPKKVQPAINKIIVKAETNKVFDFIASTRLKTIELIKDLLNTNHIILCLSI
jgi:hypothetical protein